MNEPQQPSLDQQEELDELLLEIKSYYDGANIQELPMAFISVPSPEHVASFYKSGHLKHPMPYLGVVLSLVFLLPSLFAHFYNPCVSYTKEIYWGVGGIFLATSIFICLSLTYRDYYTQYCSWDYFYNHAFAEVGMVAALGSMICSFSVFAWAFNGYNTVAIFAALWMFGNIMVAGLFYIPVFLHRHYTTCHLRGKNHLVTESGDIKAWKNAVLALDIINIILLFACLIVPYAISGYFNSNQRPLVTCIF